MVEGALRIHKGNTYTDIEKHIGIVSERRCCGRTAFPTSRLLQRVMCYRLYTDSEFSGRSTLKEMSFPQSLLPSFSLPLPKLFELFHDKEVHKCGSVPAVLTDRTYLQTNSSLVTSISKRFYPFPL